MGVFEGITHSEEIEQLVSDAQFIYDCSVKRLESQKKRTAYSLESLGKMKLEAWSGDMNMFLNRFGAFANVQMKCIADENVNFIDRNLTPNQLMVNMRTATLNANEVLKAGALSIGTGALVGIASYGGAMMFAKASTGTAIATLSGVAKTNATLAWFGGGSLKAGGLGMLGGKVVLAGIVLAPIAVVAGTIAAAKGQQRLAEAQRVHAEAEEAAAKMNTVIAGMEGIESISKGYMDLISGLSNQFRPFLREMESISKDYRPGPDGKIDFNQLSEMEQKTLHLSWLLAQLYYHSLSKPILTEDGRVDPQASNMLAYSMREYRQLSLNVTSLTAEKEQIKTTLFKARSSFSNGMQMLEKQRVQIKEFYENLGARSFQNWNNSITHFVDSLSLFENINVKNVLTSSSFNMDINESFYHIFNISNRVRNIVYSNFASVDDGVIIDAGIYGINLLESITLREGTTKNENDSGTAIWLQYGFATGRELVVADVLSSADISYGSNLLNSITGKENLNTASFILSEITKLVNKMNTAIANLNNGKVFIGVRNKYLSYIGQKLSLYKDEIANIAMVHSGQMATIDYELLDLEEKNVIQMACNLIKLYYHVACSNIFACNNGINNINIARVNEEAKDEIKKLIKVTFSMSGSEQRAADVLWAPEAKKMFFINFGFIGVVAFITMSQLFSGALMGLLGIVAIIIAIPHFFYFKSLSQSKLCLWRLIRLVAGVIIVVSELIIGLVV